MYNYFQDDHRQKIELMRRCTAAALHDVFTFSEELDDVFKILFFHASGISTIALFFGCTEVEVMRKIQEWDLYSWFHSPGFQTQLREHNANYDELPEDPHGQNQNFRRVQLMRKATSHFNSRQFIWTEAKLQLLHSLFCTGIDISEIALTLGCTEPMVIQKLLDESYYNSMDFPLFSYNSQES